MSVLLREAIGDSIRRVRTERHRTLRDVSGSARVSLGYLSEIERGRKEPSSELLAAICEALAMPLPDLLDEVADALRPAGARRRPALVDPALRSAVEEALEPVGEECPGASDPGDAAVPAEGASPRPASGSAAPGDAHASATDPTEAPDALAGADDDLDGVLDGTVAAGPAEPATPPGTVRLVAHFPVSASDASLREPARAAA